MTSKLEPPLITIGIITLNRGWIINKILRTIENQDYPHDKLHLLIIDGQSHDNTVEIASSILDKSDFQNFEIYVIDCNIPKARNICIDKMKGEMLLFWDSDVFMRKGAVNELVRVAQERNIDIAHAKHNYISFRNKEEAFSKIETLIECDVDVKEVLREVPAATMGHTLISKKVLQLIKFDEDLTFCEDLEFSYKARQNGFKIADILSVVAYDVNIVKQNSSDIYIDMPLRYAIKGLRKKAKYHVLSLGFKVTLKTGLYFFWENKRYLYYLGYIPMIIFSLFGILYPYLFAIFPLYILGYTIISSIRRGLRMGIKATVKSVVVGLPIAILYFFYFIKYSISPFHVL